MLIEIAETHPAQVGRKSATVIAKGGQRFDVWPEQLADFRIGAKYDVDVSERTFKGRTYQSITKARPINGVARSNGAAGAAAADGESQFIGAVLAGLIAAGQVTNDRAQLYEATMMLRGLWGATFGCRPRNGKSQ
jgi:hypothetical protein